MNKTTIVTIFIILVIASGIIYFKNFQSAAVKDIPSEEVAKWIGSHSVLYVQTGCIHCEEQEDLFGYNVRYLTIIDEKDMQEFIDAGIESTPTWIINGQKYAGVQPIEKLKELTGYQ